MDFTLRTKHVFPVGTTVTVYKATSRREGARPIGDAITSAVMLADGATFTGLDGKRNYVAYAEVDGQHRYVSFGTYPPPPLPATKADVAEVEQRVAGVELGVATLSADKVDKGQENTISADHEVQVGSGFTFLNLANIKQQQFNVLDYGAKGDGSTDDAPAIRAALEAARDAGGGTVLAPPGTYALKTQSEYDHGDNGKHVLECFENTRLIGAGVGATILKAHDDLPDDSPVVWTQESSVEVAHLTIDGNKASVAEPWSSEREGIDAKLGAYKIYLHDLFIHDCNDGIDLDDTHTALIDRVVIEDCAGHGIHVTGVGGTDKSRNVISNVITRRNGYERRAAGGAGAETVAGIEFASPHTVVSNCVSEGDVRGIVQRDGQRTVISNCVVKDPGIEDDPDNTSYGIAAMHSGIDTVISGCVVESYSANTAPGLYIDANRVVITGCRVHQGAAPAIELDGASLDYALMSSCLTSFNRGIHITEASATGRIVLDGVVIHGASGQVPLLIGDGAEVNLSGVNVAATSATAIEVDNCDLLQVSASTIVSDASAMTIKTDVAAWIVSDSYLGYGSGTAQGLRIEDSSDGTARGLVIDGSGLTGIDLRGAGTENVLVEACRVLNSPTHGIRMLAAVGNEPSDCRVLNCDVPSITENGSGHIIKNNVIAGEWVADGTSNP